MSSKENVEHEQIPPEEMERINNNFRSEIKNAFVMLTSPKENVRRLGAITLRRLQRSAVDTARLLARR